MTTGREDENWPHKNIPSLPVKDGVLAYRDLGQGDCIFFLHAGIADSRMWLPHVDALQDQARLIMPDLRGFGASMLPDTRFSHVDDIYTLCDALDVRSMILVGASFGARIAYEFTRAHPERVCGLVLCAPVLRDFVPEGALVEFNTAEDRLLDAGELDAATELNLRTWVDGPLRRADDVDPVLRSSIGEMQRLAFTNPVPENVALSWPAPPTDPTRDEIKCPILIIVGELDHPQVLEHARGHAERLAKARLEVIPGAAHLPSSEKPALFNRLLLDFLAAAQTPA